MRLSRENGQPRALRQTQRPCPGAEHEWGAAGKTGPWEAHALTWVPSVVSRALTSPLPTLWLQKTLVKTGPHAQQHPEKGSSVPHWPQGGWSVRKPRLDGGHPRGLLPFGNCRVPGCSRSSRSPWSPTPGAPCPTLASLSIPDRPRTCCRARHWGHRLGAPARAEAASASLS